MQNIETWIQDREKFEEEIKKKTKSLEENIESMDSDIEALSREVNSVKKENKNLKEHILKMECQSPRYNLVLDGITETMNESATDCKQKVYRILAEKLEFDNSENIEIVRCHRIGPVVPGRSRSHSVIFKLAHYADRAEKIKRDQLLAF